MPNRPSTVFIFPSIKLEKFGSPLVQWILIFILSLAFASGAITGYFEARHALEPLWSDYATNILLIILTLSWYHVDSNDRRYDRNIWLNMLILGLAIIGIPFYLIRSRVQGKKLAAIGWLIVFTCLFTSLNLLGTALMGWLV
ncbi:hypothetical protein [Solimicrobium silvestre]|uniref:Uncharacterized protein n=1 Tax=Solimicrobium silvestre TaxID=2099400 RepID=A0A2S9GVL0_9BURK|nr:hypothetical protein [Solimicrobium silvestre]PRC91750.1 hypothetical protein S2091_3505 [Solimicrobium silvestre]